jgi:hypothetical protein
MPVSPIQPSLSERNPRQSEFLTHHRLDSLPIQWALGGIQSGIQRIFGGTIPMRGKIMLSVFLVSTILATAQETDKSEPTSYDETEAYKVYSAILPNEWP